MTKKVKRSIHETNESVSFEHWSKTRDAILVRVTGLPSFGWPDLTMYRDEYEDGVSAIASAAYLMDEVCNDMGECLSDIYPKLAEYI